jgi:hypothetical protein
MRPLLIFLCTLLSAPTIAEVNIQVEYSESADYFDLLDNLSNWWEGFTEPEYGKEWQNRFGVFTELDRASFEKYRKLREKYYNDPDQSEKDPLKNRNGFFSMTSTFSADPLAEAFYDSSKLEEAYKKLEKLLDKQELEGLISFHRQYNDRVSKILKESVVFKKILPKVQKSLKHPGIDKYLSEIAAFYKVTPALDYRILFTWFPPIERSNASPTGKYLLMRYNPLKHLEMAAQDSDIAFHEIVHVISNKQPLEQKQLLTEQFLKSCQVKDQLKKLTILEEPLAVVFGQAIFLERFDPKRLNLGESLYNNPWISSYAKLLLPIVKTQLKAGKSIADDFIPTAASLCNELKGAASKLGLK